MRANQRLYHNQAVTNTKRFFPQAELRGLKVLPPHGAWVTDASEARGCGSERWSGRSLLHIR